MDIQRSILAVVNKVFAVSVDPANSKWLIPALLTIDAVLCALILRTVNYTEIDWRAYMEQVELFIKGERDYTLIKGSTGPLVYPAAHVWIYRTLYEVTYDGTSIVLAQVYFAFLYILTLGVVMLCYRAAKAPPYIFPMLILSKRLHSIFLLRLFNDCWATAALFICIYLLQTHRWTWASIVFSLGLAIKMNLLLVAPALASILYQALGGSSAFRQGVTIVNIQALIAFPFLKENWRGYITRAFELTRTFLYKWTVNWRFVDESVFLSRGFALALLAVHVSILIAFLATRWQQPMKLATGRKTWPDLFDAPQAARTAVINNLTPQFILTTMLTANVVGMLCARSLHYQFYAWLGWATPFLLWRAKLNPLMQYMLWAGQEYAWNVYPSTDLSSKIVVGVLGLTVLEVWLGTDAEKKEQVPVPVVLDEGVTNRVRESDEDRLYKSLLQED